jgi:hypothetical protein
MVVYRIKSLGKLREMYGPHRILGAGKRVVRHWPLADISITHRMSVQGQSGLSLRKSGLRKCPLTTQKPDPHAPSAADFRSAYQDLVNAQRDFERVVSGDAQPSLEASRQGIARAAEAIVERWHGVADDARYSLVRNFRQSTQDTKQSTKQLEAAMKAAEQGEAG